MTAALSASAKPTSANGRRPAGVGALAFDVLIGLVNVVTLGRYHRGRPQHRR